MAVAAAARAAFVAPPGFMRRGPAGMSKEQAEAVLRRSAVNGDFLVRQGSGQQYHVLSRFFGGKVLHARIVSVPTGFRFDGAHCTIFASIEKLISNYQSNALADGCKLLPAPPPGAALTMDAPSNSAHA